MRKKILSEWHPELIPEWSERNLPITPEMAGTGSGKKYWWKCSRGHEWETSPYVRIAGHGCPYCAGIKIWPGENDIATTDPEIMEEWDPENIRSPSDITSKSKYRARWICKTCGFHFKMQVVRRVWHDAGCPACTNWKACVGHSDIFAMRPEIAGEWDYERNKRPPDTYPAESKYPVWWKGACGHSYRARIADRYHGQGCRICEKEQTEYIPEKSFIHYLGKLGIEYILNYREISGIPIEIYLPGQNVAVEFSSPAETYDYCYSRERCKNIICRRAGIKMLRIQAHDARPYDNCPCITRNDDSAEALSEAIATAFRLLDIYDKMKIIDVTKDMDEIKVIPFKRMLYKEYKQRTE